jgi:hypothetical protein
MYQLTDNPNIIQRLDDGVFIPANPANSDYAAYLAWIAAGNTPQAAPSRAADNGVAD